MRIGFDITPLSVPRSGVGTYTACLLDHLRQAGEEIVPLSHYPDGYRWSPEVDSPPSRPINKTAWMQFVLPWKLRRLGLDLCHFTNSVAPLWTPCPSVITIHDMTLWLHPSYHPRRRLAAMRPVIPLVARRAAAIITVSRSARDDIVRLLDVAPEKVTVIYEAPDAVFSPIHDEAALAALQRQYQLPSQFILHVGTLEPRKNLVRLLEAYAGLHHHKAIPHHLLFAGQKGWHYQEIFAAVERLELGHAVHFMDYVSNRALAGLYNLADALVFPSLYEGFGLPVVEAMACGTPVITSPNGSLKEITADAAAYFIPEEVDSIATVIHQVLTAPSMQVDLKNRGLARAATFSWQQTADQTRQLYGRVIAKMQPAAAAAAAGLE